MADPNELIEQLKQNENKWNKKLILWNYESCKLNEAKIRIEMEKEKKEIESAFRLRDRADQSRKKMIEELDAAIALQESEAESKRIRMWSASVDESLDLADQRTQKSPQ